jgi:hypothetical protein
MQPRFPPPSLPTGLHAAGPLPPGPAATIPTCVVMAGAGFGIAAQTLLQHAGLDFESIRVDVLAHRVATRHFALAWWACCLLALGAFLVGPLCAAATRAIVGHRLARGPLWFAIAGAVLGLAAVAQPRSFPPAAAVATSVLVSLVVVIGSALLALLGAHLVGGISRGRTATPLRAQVGDRLRRWQGSTACPGATLKREGSANGGPPPRSARGRHPWVRQPFSSARAALVTWFAVLVFAPVSVLASSAIVLHSGPAAAIRAWNLWRTTPTSTDARSRARTLVPADEAGLTVAVAAEAPAILDRVWLPAPRRRELSVALGHGATLSESELTFTKGYPRRRAAQLAAGLISEAMIPQVTTAATVANNESRPRVARHRHAHARFAESGRKRGEPRS